MLGFAFVLCLSRLSLQTLLVKVGFIMDQLYKMQKNAARHAFPFEGHRLESGRVRYFRGVGKSQCRRASDEPAIRH